VKKKYLEKEDIVEIILDCKKFTESLEDKFCEGVGIDAEYILHLMAPLSSTIRQLAEINTSLNMILIEKKADKDGN
jgi:hypothetical protein